MDRAELSAGEKAGDCGICRRRGVPRADLGAAGFANCEGGMMMRGDCGLERSMLSVEASLFSVAVDLFES